MRDMVQCNKCGEWYTYKYGCRCEKDRKQTPNEQRVNAGLMSIDTCGVKLSMSDDMLEMEKITNEIKNEIKPFANIISGQGKMEKTDFGAMRESNDGRGRFDLLPYEAIEALAKWYEAGAKKYAERNWEDGLSVKDCVNRMIRHSLKAGNGWTDEDHLAAVMWNAAAAITMMKRHPECNDHVWKDEK